MDGRLTFSERIALRLHLFACDACARLTGHVRFLRRALRSYPGPNDQQAR
jgi:anti-sigma factor RsiW